MRLECPLSLLLFVFKRFFKDSLRESEVDVFEFKTFKFNPLSIRKNTETRQ